MSDDSARFLRQRQPASRPADLVVSRLSAPVTGLKLLSLEAEFEPSAIPAAQGAVARQEDH